MDFIDVVPHDLKITGWWPAIKVLYEREMDNVQM